MTTKIPPPSFEQLMQRYHGEMRRLLDAAKMKCPGPGQKCAGCAFISDDEDTHCALPEIEKHIGDPALYCSPCEPTQPECGPCKGPAPKCPKCGSPTFLANIDDQDMILCTNDACKWKWPAEIGLCKQGRAIKHGILCELPRDETCPHQDWNATHEVCWCNREAAALAALAKYEQEDRR